MFCIKYYFYVLFYLLGLSRHAFIGTNPSSSGRPCPSPLLQWKPCPAVPCYSWQPGPWTPCQLHVRLIENYFEILIFNGFLLEVLLELMYVKALIKFSLTVAAVMISC